MDVKEAIDVAKNYIYTIYEEEGVFNIGLEEIQLDGNSWDVTIGFSRKWDRPQYGAVQAALGKVEGEDYRAIHRTYKIVEIEDETGRVIAVRNRPTLL